MYSEEQDAGVPFGPAPQPPPSSARQSTSNYGLRAIVRRAEAYSPEEERNRRSYYWRFARQERALAGLYSAAPHRQPSTTAILRHNNRVVYPILTPIEQIHNSNLRSREATVQHQNSQAAAGAEEDDDDTVEEDQQMEVEQQVSAEITEDILHNPRITPPDEQQNILNHVAREIANRRR